MALHECRHESDFENIGEAQKRLFDRQDKNILDIVQLTTLFTEAEKDHARIRAEMLKEDELLRAERVREVALIRAETLEKYGPMKEYFWEKGKPSIEWVIEYRKTLKAMAISLITAAILSICGVFMSLYVNQQQNIAVQAALQAMQRGGK